MDFATPAHTSESVTVKCLDEKTAVSRNKSYVNQDDKTDSVAFLPCTHEWFVWSDAVL